MSFVTDDWVLQADRGKLPCAICRADPPTWGLPYRSYDGVQVFVCDDCNDRIQPSDGDLDEDLWQRAIDVAVVTRAVFLTYAASSARNVQQLNQDVGMARFVEWAPTGKR